MLDRVLSRSLALAVVGLISLGCGAGLYLLFTAWNECLVGQWLSMSFHAAACLICVAAVWALCCYREELVDI